MGWNQMKQAEKVLTRDDYWKGPEHIIHKAGLKVLIFGDPEVGKTHFALTFPPPIYVVDTES